MEKWTESSLLMKLQRQEAETLEYSVEADTLARFLMTLRAFKIYKNEILLEDLGSIAWRYASNYYMGRKFKNGAH